MKMQMRFVVAALVSMIGAADLRAQDPNAQDVPLVLQATGAQRAADGTPGLLELTAGASFTATLGGEPGRYLAGAVFVSGATTVGEFTFLPQGLVMLGTFDASGTLAQTITTDPALAGVMLSARGYAYDGATIDESATITIRFL